MVERDQFADPQAGVRQRHDDRVIALLEVGQERLGQRGRSNLLHLSRLEPGLSLRRLGYECWILSRRVFDPPEPRCVLLPPKILKCVHGLGEWMGFLVTT